MNTIFKFKDRYLNDNAYSWDVNKNVDELYKNYRRDRGFPDNSSDSPSVAMSKT